MITRNTEMAREERAGMRGGEGTVTLEHWFKPEDFGAQVRLCARMTLPPGASIGTHVHESEDEVYIVIAGCGVIEENGAQVPIAAGDAILTGHNGSHGVRNTGSEPLVIAAIINRYA
jgi:mannose-6-phosphate isomerase-like protein (cupin superfamily)